MTRMRDLRLTVPGNSAPWFSLSSFLWLHLWCTPLSGSVFLQDPKLKLTLNPKLTLNQKRSSRSLCCLY